MNKQRILSTVDLERLRAMIRDAVTTGSVPRSRLCALNSELGQAQIVAPREMPKGVVTMNSTVRCHDLDGEDEEETYTLVYPGFADPAQGCLSILAPLGTALLGHREGEVVEWDSPFGRRRLRLEEVTFQPESVGLYDV